MPHPDKPDYANYRKAVRLYIDVLQALKNETLKRIEETRDLLADHAPAPKGSFPDHEDRHKGML